MKTFIIFTLLHSLTLSACIGPHSWDFDTTQIQASEQMHIYALSVGQGDATLIVGPNGQAGLIDAGPPEAGREIILPTLRTLGIHTLSWVIISHYDADHLGGLLEVLMGEDEAWNTSDDIIVFQGIWDRGGNKLHHTPWFEAYQSTLTKQGLRQTIAADQELWLDEQVRIKVLLVAGAYADGHTIPLNADEENEASIALLVEYHNFRYLTAGDLTGGGFSGARDTKDLESYLAELTGPVDIVHLNHHGSRTSTNLYYLEQLNPQQAIISSGPNNRFQHPHSEIVDRLKTLQIPYLNTAANTVHIKVSPKGYETR